MFDTKSPQNLEQALQIALAVQEAEKQVSLMRVFILGLKTWSE